MSERHIHMAGSVVERHIIRGGQGGDRDVYEYALLRVVPRVERGECINAGVLVYCRAQAYVGARTHLDEARLLALDPAADVAVNPRVSLKKVSGHDLSFGPVSDISLIARYERASYADFRSYNHGISFNFDVPGFAYFESGVLRRHTNFYQGEWLWRSVLMSKPLPFAGQRFHFNLLSLVNGTGENGTEVFLRPELLWEVDAKGSVQLGLRYETHRYKVNDVDYSRNSPNIMLKWNM